MLNEEEIKKIATGFGIEVETVGERIDSSRAGGEERYHYCLNQKYMLKVNTSSYVDEAFLKNMQRDSWRIPQIMICMH